MGRSFPGPLVRHGLTETGLRIDCPTMTANSPAAARVASLD